MSSPPPPSLPPDWWRRVRHDLRGAISPVRMAVQLLRSGRVDAAEREEALSVIDRQFEQMLETVDDIGELLRLQSGPLQLQVAQQDANLLLDLVCGRGGLIRTLAERKLGIRCEPCEREALVAHDPVRASALLEFLLMRMAAHADAGGELRLALRQGDVVELHLSGAKSSLADDEDLRYLLEGGTRDPSLRAILMRELLRADGVALEPAAGGVVLRFPAGAA